MADAQRALITGGAGFVGSHLAEALLNGGNYVTVVDDLSTGRWENIAQLGENPKFRALIASASDVSAVNEEVARHDVVYHLASAVGVRLVIERPVHTVETIFHPTDVVLNACSRYRRPVVLTSTSEVYGKSTSIPFREDADVVMGPTEKRRWAYACAKALDEFLALAHFHETSLPVFIVRLFNTVGTKQTGQYGMVLPSFIRQALEGAPITVYGSGSQSRCFCSVHDVIDGLIKLPTVRQAAGSVINMGSDEEISILELAHRVIALTGSVSKPVLVPYDRAYGPGFDDMMRRIPDLTRARDLLQWAPKWKLDQTILEITDYVKRSPLRAV